MQTAMAVAAETVAADPSPGNEDEAGTRQLCALHHVLSFLGGECGGSLEAVYCAWGERVAHAEW